MFRFALPQYLYLLLLVPVLVGLYIYILRQRRRRLEKFGALMTLRQLMPEASLPRVRNKFLLSLTAVVCIIFALARPQFGSKLKEVKQEGIELMLAVDVSNSMLAEDFEPNRLERTKFAINRLLNGLRQDRVGLIIFAGNAYVQLPITSDYATARNFASRISPTMVSRQGTAIGAAIDLAAGSYSSQSEGSRVMILITDGENHEDDALAAAQRAAEKGVQIYVIGIGTPEGAPIRIGNDFIRDDKGNMVVSKLDESILERIALTTGGAYIRATKQSIGLDEMIERINQTQKSRFSATVFEAYDEQYQYLVGLALLLLVVEFYILPRKNRILARFSIFKQHGAA